MPLPSFENEADFREKFIAPLLSRLGYIQVAHTHGVGEQGKDFIFADYDRFDHLRIYAAQAKNGNIGAGNVELGLLLDQVKRSFRVRIRHRHGLDERRVSAVYIMASGKISDTAREYIAEYCRSESYGENVYFLDGDRLEHLERSARLRDESSHKERLAGLLNEVTVNLSTCNLLANHLATTPGNLIAYRLRLAAHEAYLVAPLPDGVLSNELVESAWAAGDEINRLSDVLNDARVLGKEIGPTMRDGVLTTLMNAIAAGSALKGAAEAAIEVLDHRFHPDIEIIRAD